MGSTGKLAAGAALSGLMLTVAVAAVIGRHPSPPMSDRAEPAAAKPIRADLARCRVITMPDSGCEAAWETRRRHFFSEEKRPVP